MIKYLKSLFGIISEGDQYKMVDAVEGLELVATVLKVKKNTIVYNVVFDGKVTGPRINSKERFKALYQERL